MIKAFKWFISRIRNTLLALLAALLLSLVILILGVAIISLIVTLTPAVVVGLFVFALYLIVAGWLRTGEAEWYKTLREKLEEINHGKEGTQKKNS